MKAKIGWGVKAKSEMRDANGRKQNNEDQEIHKRSGGKVKGADRHVPRTERVVVPGKGPVGSMVRHQKQTAGETWENG